MRIFCFFLLLICTGCSHDEERAGFDNLEKIKKDFITTILTESALEEGPFRMNYNLKATLFSENVVSLMGDLFVYAHLPHGWHRYEGKTYVKTNGSFKEITLGDMFPLDHQKEFLRCYCENALENRGKVEDARLDLRFLKTFVVDHESLIFIFQSYTVGGFSDGPHTVKIPFTELIGKWQAGNSLEKLLPIKNYLSSWDSEVWISDVQDVD